MNIFKEKEYDFTDSIVSEFEWDSNTLDYILTIDCYVGKASSLILTLRLKNVKKIQINANILDNNDHYAPYTLSKIIKRKHENHVEMVCESAFSFLPEFEKDLPLLYCLCDEIYIENTNANVEKFLNAF
ncbi:MAG: hypothetical protein J1G04_00960 [Clostridiales bacterium]|nr:hypothetical protein [Clostridiales bacterium]